MNTTIKTKDLKDAFSQVKKVICKRPSVIITENYYLKSDGETLKVIGTDIENTLIFSVPCQGAIECVLPELDKILSKISSQDISISVNDKITVEAGNDKFTFPINSDPFPFKEIENKNLVCKINSTDLASEIKRQTPFRSLDDLRMSLTGTYFEIDSDFLTLTTTDANALITCKLKAESVNLSKSQFILQGKACKIIETIKANDCYIYLSDDNVIFEMANVVLISRMIDANYPNYRQVIPEDCPISVGLNPDDLLKALDKSMLINEIKAAFTFNGKLTIHAENIHTEQEYNTIIPANNTGNNITIGFSPKLLTKCIKGLDRLNIELTSPNKAAIINRDQSGLILCMPVMLNI